MLSNVYVLTENDICSPYTVQFHPNSSGANSDAEKNVCHGKRPI